MEGSDIKLDIEQRARAVALEPQVIDDPEWACAAIIWQRDQLADRDAEIERLRADLVWSVRKGVMVSHDENLRPCVWFDVHRGVECDGTPDSICRAVREARDGD
jgi:hypothetical protein